MKKTNKFSPEVRERAVRMVQEQRGEYPSLWAAIESIAPKIGCVPQTLNEWVKRAEVDAGMFAESLNDPVVSVTVQFNETALAEKGEWLEQPNMQVYPLIEGTGVPYFWDNAPTAVAPLDFARERSVLEEDKSIPQTNSRKLAVPRAPATPTTQQATA